MKIEANIFILLASSYIISLLIFTYQNHVIKNSTFSNSTKMLTDLRHKRAECSGSQVGALSTHIRTGQNHQALVFWKSFFLKEKKQKSYLRYRPYSEWMESQKRFLSRDDDSPRNGEFRSLEKATYIVGRICSINERLLFGEFFSWNMIEK